MLRDVALNDSEPEVRSTAIQYLARSPSDIAVNTLDEVLRTSTDQGVQRTAARALATNPSPRAKQAVRALIERADAPERLRMEAIGGFENSDRTTDEDAAYLRSIYTKIDNPRIKARIARVIGQLAGEQNDQWLLGLMRNNDEPLEVRTAALSRVASVRIRSRPGHAGSRRVLLDPRWSPGSNIPRRRRSGASCRAGSFRIGSSVSGRRRLRS